MDHEKMMLIADSSPLISLALIGTLGILLEAKKEGLITALKPFIAELVSHDIRISTKIMEMTLQAAQE